MIDWNALAVGPTTSILGEPATYSVDGGVPFPITAVFFDGSKAVSPIEEPGVISTAPRIGVQLSQFPAGYDPQNAQGDTFTITRTGVTYVVRAGWPDGLGGAHLEANEQ